MLRRMLGSAKKNEGGFRRPPFSSEQREGLNNKRNKNAAEIKEKDDRIADLEGACLQKQQVGTLIEFNQGISFAGAEWYQEEEGK